MKGFVNILKQENMSSAYAVGGVKWKLKTPCGHMGTLDPMATGVLPIGIGKTSRLFDYLLDKEKTYIADFQFGYLTDTLDKTGVTIDTTTNIPKKPDIENVLYKFIGEIDQIPPKYSAKCVDGKRGYQLARSGVDFTLKPKKVIVNDFKILEQKDERTFTFQIDCKGGTYIRSLARDLGNELNSLATMIKLERTKCGIFTIENSVTLDEFKKSDTPEKYIIKSEDAIFFPILTLNNRQATRLLNGLYDDYNLDDGLYKVFCGLEFWGVGEIKDKKLRMKSYVR